MGVQAGLVASWALPDGETTWVGLPAGAIDRGQLSRSHLSVVPSPFERLPRLPADLLRSISPAGSLRHHKPTTVAPTAFASAMTPAPQKNWLIPMLQPTKSMNTPKARAQASDEALGGVGSVVPTSDRRRRAPGQEQVALWAAVLTDHGTVP